MRRGKIERIRNNVWKEVAVIFLAVFSVALLVYELSADLLADQSVAIHRIDLFISLLFLTDFLVGLSVAQSKTQYFRQNWPDLIASIPITEGVFQLLRGLRLPRIVRVLRVAARMRQIAVISERLVDDGAKYIYAMVITTIVILTAAVSFYSVELDVNPSGDNLFDAIW